MSYRAVGDQWLLVWLVNFNFFRCIYVNVKSKKYKEAGNNVWLQAHLFGVDGGIDIYSCVPTALCTRNSSESRVQCAPDNPRVLGLAEGLSSRSVLSMDEHLAKTPTTDFSILDSVADRAMNKATRDV